MTFLRRTKIQGLVDANNSTSTPLGIGGVFTGTATEILNYGIIYINIYSDVASAIDGLSIQQSTDGTNWDHIDVYTVPSSTGKTFSFNPSCQWLRVVYTNGGVGQTAFRLQTVIKGNSKPSSHRIQDDITNEDDAELVKSVLATDVGDGETFSSINVDNPLSTDGDAIYVKDLDLDNCNIYNFTGGTVQSLFNNDGATLADSTANNPKTIEVRYKRQIVTSGISVTNDSGAGSFKGVKVEVLQGSTSYTTVYDGSASVVPFTARFFSFTNTVGNDTIGIVGITGFKITFHTADTVTLTQLGMRKHLEVNATLSALKSNGASTYIGATNDSHLKVSLQEYGDTPAIDPFDRLRVSNPYTLFDSKQLHDKQPLFWDEAIGGSATSVHVPANAETDMTVTANAADYVIRQTKQKFNYQPGKGQLVLMTFHAPQVSGLTKRIGCFDGTGVNYLTPNNGIFFECDGTISWNIAKNGSTTETVTQANWNVDKLNGNGNSGITLDLSAAQILVIDYEWLGVGRVRVGFVIDGIVRYCHYFNHANDSTYNSVYMSTPNLPLRYDIQTDGTNGSHLSHICASVMSEGGLEKRGVLRAVETGNALIGTYSTSTSYAIIGIKLKTAYHDISIIPEAINMVIGTSDYFKWELQLNPTVNGTFTYSDLTNSSIQAAVTLGTTNTIAASGMILSAGGGSASSRFSSADLQTALRLGSTIAGVQDELVLVFTPLSSNITMWASLSFRELL